MLSSGFNACLFQRTPDIYESSYVYEPRQPLIRDSSQCLSQFQPNLVRSANVLDELLDYVLGPAVWVGAVAGQVVLVDGQVLGVTEHGWRRREDQTLHIELVHHLEQEWQPACLGPLLYKYHFNISSVVLNSDLCAVSIDIYRQNSKQSYWNWERI